MFYHAACVEMKAFNQYLNTLKLHPISAQTKHTCSLLHHLY